MSSGNKLYKVKGGAANRSASDVLDAGKEDNVYNSGESSEEEVAPTDDNVYNSGESSEEVGPMRYRIPTPLLISPLA